MRRPANTSGDASGNLHSHQSLPTRHAHSPRGIDCGRVDPLNAGDRVAQHGQQAVDDQGDHRRRDTEPEKREEQHQQADAGNRLTEVGDEEDRHTDQRAPPGRSPPRRAPRFAATMANETPEMKTC